MENKCIQCGTLTKSSKYCSNKCQQDYQSNQKKQKFLDGGYVGVGLQFRANEWTRKLVVEHYGYHCSSCGISEWNGKPILLEVNHIDGKSKNNILENLELLCPNCHSQTDTYRAKNTNSDRSYRRKPA